MVTNGETAAQTKTQTDPGRKRPKESKCKPFSSFIYKISHIIKHQLLISHHPSISSEVEEPQPGPQMVAAFRTAQLRSDRQKRGSIKSAPLYPRSEPDSKIRLALYSSSFGSISDTTNDGKQQGAGKRLSSHEQEDYDPILAHITAQRSRLGLQTTPTKSPDTAEGSNYMDLLLATSEPIAGVRDLKKLSKKLSHMRLESEGRVQERKVIARDFVYAVQKGDRGRGAKYNPYDLRIVPADIARQHSLHYTISAFSVSEVCDDTVNAANKPPLFHNHVPVKIKCRFKYELFCPVR